MAVTTTRRHLAVGLAGLAAATLLAACSDDDSAPAPEAANVTTTTEGADSTQAETTTTTSAPAAEFVAAELTRNDDGSLTITWELDGPGDPVEFSQGSDGSTFDAPYETVEGAVGPSAVSFIDPAPGGRAYFRLTSGDAHITVAERRVALEGAPNFRDLGGYLTEDGRRVRWGQIFRSGSLFDLTPGDLALVESLGIRLVCDLRSDSEVEEEPDPELGAESLRLAVTDESVDVQAITDAILAGDLDSIDPNLLRDGMPLIATGFDDSWTTLLERLADPANRPTNVHCTAGKDRGGFAAALVLRTLGVPVETVMQDYLLSNTYLEASNAETIAQVRSVVAAVNGIPEDQVDMSNLVALLEVREEYLQAAFDAIDAQYGSFDVYLEEALGVTDEELAAFRDGLLE